MKAISAVMLATVAIAAVWDDTGDVKMEFAYLISRHGARTAYLRNPENNLFGLGVDETNARLTPQGMRQCYLRGRWNKARYYDLISDDFIPG